MVDKDGNVAINGGNLTTTQNSASLFNSNATQISIGGAGTAISVGASTGTTTINNKLAVTGNLEANGILNANNTFNAYGIANIGDGGDTITLNGSNLTMTATGTFVTNLADNTDSVFVVKQGSNQYLNVTTTTGAQNIAFGNITTNPTYSFNGSGLTTFGGNIAVNGGSLISSSSAASIFNTTVTNLNIGGAASVISIGAPSGTTTFNGNAAVSGNLAVNGPVSADITSTTNTATVFNSGVTSLSIGNAASTLSLGATGGTTTVNSKLNVTGNLTANADFVANGQITLQPSGTNGINIITDADSLLNIGGLSIPETSAYSLCLDSSNNVVKCPASASTLQSAYNGGNSILTTNNRDIVFNLADTATDSNFIVNTLSGSTGGTEFIRNNGSGTANPTQLVLIDNADITHILPIGLKIGSSGTSGVTTAIDVSDPSIVTALSFGSNDISGNYFTVQGSTGNVTTNGTLAVNGGSITTTSTGTTDIFNTNTTNLSIGGAATTLTLGATSGTATIRNGSIELPNATALDAGNALLTIDSASIGGGYSSSGVTISNTGNIQANGTLTVDSTSVLTGDVTAGGNLAVNGGNITTTTSTGNIFNSPTTLNIGQAATTVSLGATSGTTTINNNLNVSENLTTVGAVSFTPGTNGQNITFNTNGSNSKLYITGLPTATGTLVCINGTNGQITQCASDAISLQSAYVGGNTITTTNNRDISFTLANTSTNSNFVVTTAARFNRLFGLPKSKRFNYLCPRPINLSQ